MKNENLPAEIQQKVNEIINVCGETSRLNERFSRLNKLGYSVNERPMPTGGGIGNVKVMNDGTYRVRVSANWGGKKGNYANCVEL